MSSEGARMARVALLALTFPACTVWRPLSRDPSLASEPRPYDHLLVITRDGYEVELSHAVVRADSIVGLGTHAHAGERLAFSQEQVARVEGREVSVGATAITVVSVVSDMATGVYRMIATLVG